VWVLASGFALTAGLSARRRESPLRGDEDVRGVALRTRRAAIAPTHGGTVAAEQAVFRQRLFTDVDGFIGFGATNSASDGQYSSHMKQVWQSALRAMIGASSGTASNTPVGQTLTHKSHLMQRASLTSSIMRPP
jgi:hypothetical protein